jgi:PAS domain S-box-containing protein
MDGAAQVPDLFFQLLARPCVPCFTGSPAAAFFSGPPKETAIPMMNLSEYPKLWWERISACPESVPPKSHRFFMMTSHGYLFALVAHTLFIPLFLWLGIPFMALFNVFSVIFYVTIIHYNLKGYLRLCFSLMMTEVFIHATLCVLILGWNSGFHYYVLVIPVAVFLTPGFRLAVKTVVVAVICLLYMVLNHYSGVWAPVNPPSPHVIAVIRDVLILSTFILLGYAGYYYTSAAELAEAALERERDLLEITVEQRTADLRESEDRYRRLYEESRRREELYHSFLTSSADAIVICDTEGKTRYVSPSFTRTFGWSEEEVLDRPIPVSTPPDGEDFMSRIARSLNRDAAVSGERMALATKEGTVLDVSVSASRYNDHEGNPAGIFAVIRNITERVRLEKQLNQAAKMEAIGQLAGGVAHDFNNLLTVIIGYTNMLLEDEPEDSPVRDKIVEISGSAERAAGLTRKLLAFSRKEVLDVRVLDLNKVVRGFESILRRIIGEDIEFTTALGTDIGMVKADPGQIEQILLNLAVNSRDAMSAGGTLIVETANVLPDEYYAKTRPEVEAGPYVMLAVTDDGCGMDADVAARVFDPFFTTKERGKGTGLGLSTVYGLVKQHGGHVFVYSEPGKGTSVKVFLPRVTDAPSAAREEEKLRVKPSAGETVLVVEDDDMVRKLTCRILMNRGYKVLRADGPEQAVAICEDFEGTIDLLLSDVIMPHMDGPTLFSRLSPTRPGMRVLYVSGYTDNAVLRNGVLNRGVDFLQKPFRAGRLASKVREILDRP